MVIVLIFALIGCLFEGYFVVHLARYLSQTERTDVFHADQATLAFIAGIGCWGIAAMFTDMFSLGNPF
jgi:hypothetical protein